MAERILEVEGPRHGGDVTAAVETAYGVLGEEIADLVTREGAAALMRRALHKARRTRPALDPVHVDTEMPPRLTGLADIEAEDPADRDALAKELLVTLLDLLIAFVGTRLTRHLVDGIWSMGSPSQSSPSRPELAIEESA